MAEEQRKRTPASSHLKQGQSVDIMDKKHEPPCPAFGARRRLVPWHVVVNIAKNENPHLHLE